MVKYRAYGPLCVYVLGTHTGDDNEMKAQRAHKRIHSIRYGELIATSGTFVVPARAIAHERGAV